MKLSVSLPDDDVRFLDEYAAAHSIASRSAALQQAIRALRLAELSGAYAGAWQEWEEGDDAGAWETTSADGL